MTNIACFVVFSHQPRIKYAAAISTVLVYCSKSNIIGASMLRNCVRQSMYMMQNKICFVEAILTFRHGPTVVNGHIAYKSCIHNL